MPEHISSFADPPPLLKNEWWVSNNSNSSTSYPPNDDFKEIYPQEVTPESEGFVKALRLALDGNLTSTTTNDSSRNARPTPTGTLLVHTFLKCPPAFIISSITLTIGGNLIASVGGLMIPFFLLSRRNSCRRQIGV